MRCLPGIPASCLTFRRSLFAHFAVLCAVLLVSGTAFCQKIEVYDRVAMSSRTATVLVSKLPTTIVGNSGAIIRNTAFIEDRRNSLTAKQILQRLSGGLYETRSGDELNNFGITESSQWFATVIKSDTGNRNGGFFLNFAGTNPDTVDLWIFHEHPDSVSEEHRLTGSLVPASHRDLEINSVAIRIDITSDNATILLWRMHNRGPSMYGFALLPQEILSAESQRDGIIIALLVGGLLSFMLLSLVLFNVTLDRTYLFFIAQLVGFALYVVSVQGFGSLYIWKGMPALDKPVVQLSTIFALGATIQLLRRFIVTRAHDPVLDRVLRALLWTLPFICGISIVLIQAGIFLLCSCLGAAVVACEIAAFRFFVREGEKSLPFVIGCIITGAGSLAGLIVYCKVQLPGTLLWALFNANCFGFFAESIFFMLALTNRIHDLRLGKEKAEQKNRLKQDFIANISHEMRTPLNGIVGFAESIAHSDHAGEIQFYNRKIISESERLLFQINQLLDLAKIEAGKLDLELKPFSLSQSLSYINSAYSMKAMSKNLGFAVSVDSECPLSLVGDRLRLEQILRNLIDNAIKFTESGSVSLAVKLQRQDILQTVLIFDISDTGIGIEQNKLDLIMEDFVQADSSVTRRYGGTGLGTSIARRLVEAMGGHIEVTSSAGKGSNFRAYVPFAPALETEILNDEPEKKSAPDVMTQTTSDRQRQVLIVDDLDTNRQILAIHLRSLPLRIDEAENGTQALDCLASKKYDLVLMDVFMPGMSGHDTTRAIRALYGAALPVIAVTASGFEQDIHDALEAGMNEILVKPVKRGVLIETVTRHLGIS